MKVLIELLENGELSLKELDLSEIIPSETPDTQIRHILVVNEVYRKDRDTGMRLTCATHLDWCLRELVSKYGEKPFENDFYNHSPSNTDWKKYAQDKFSHILGLFEEDNLSIEDLTEIIEELQ